MQHTRTQHPAGVAAAAVLLGSLLLWGCASSSQPPPAPALLSALPAASLHPLLGAGSACSCHAYAANAAMHGDDALASLTPQTARLRLDGVVVDLDTNATGNAKAPEGSVRRNFGTGQRSASFVLHEVPVQPVCSAASDPPPHGSCFSGTLEVRNGGQTAATPVKLLCGC